MSPTAEKRLLKGMEALRLALDPEEAKAKAEWEVDDAKRRYVGASYWTKTSGWGKRGPPQCPGCRRPLSGHGVLCPNCRTYNGNYSQGR